MTRRFLLLAVLFLAGIFCLIPAQARVVASASNNGITVELRDTSDWCPNGLPSAVWRQPQPPHELKGCYMVDQGRVFVIWENGDTDVFAASVFKRNDL